MRVISAEKFLKFTTDELFHNLEGDFIVKFADGEIATNEREVVFSSYAWEFHRRYPRTPMLMKHHLNAVKKNGEPGGKAFLELLENCYWSVYDTYCSSYEDKRDLIDELNRLGYESCNDVYCLTRHLGAFVTSLNIMDFINITRSQPVIEATTTAPATEEGMNHVNTVIQSEIKNNPLHKRNPLAVAVRTGISRLGQALQCTGFRGFLTDVDSDIFRYPIMSGHIRGIRRLYDSLIESRSAAKSLMHSQKPLQDSEYFSRRQQLVCQNVQNLHMGDCGSTKYLLWKIRSKGTGDGENPNGDLRTLAGKYYLDEDVGTYKILRESDTHLIGKTLKLRSLVTGCMHPDPNGICEYCYGESGISVPKDSNIGQVACVTLAAILGQLILSTKHYDGTSVAENIILRGIEKKYFSVGSNGITYMLNEKLRSDKIYLYVNIENCPGLVDIKLSEDMRVFTISRVSEFNRVFIELIDSDGVSDKQSLDVYVSARNSSMTHELLTHIRKVGYEIIDNSYRIDLTNWDYSKPLFALPLSHYNMSNHQAEIASALEATAADLKRRNNDISPDNMIVEFHDLVNKRLTINLSVLEVIVYSAMIVDASDNNYSLPKPWTKAGFGIMRNILKNRSISALMAYQGHRDSFVNPESYLYTSRMDHILDAAIMPQETLSNEEYMKKRFQ